MTEQKHSACPFCGGEVDPTGWLRGDGARGPECEGCGATAPSMAVWEQRAALAQPSPAPELDDQAFDRNAERLTAEALGTGGGINDAADGFAACNACGWIGKEPATDKCPGCQRENVMTAACPKCHCRYTLIADGYVTTPFARVQEGYALVPIEPTTAMVDAGMTVDIAQYESHFDETWAIYQAMIAAAPTQGDSNA